MFRGERKGRGGGRRRGRMRIGGYCIIYLPTKPALDCLGISFYFRPFIMILKEVLMKDVSFVKGTFKK